MFSWYGWIWSVRANGQQPIQQKCNASQHQQAKQGCECPGKQAHADYVEHCYHASIRAPPSAQVAFAALNVTMSLRNHPYEFLSNLIAEARILRASSLVFRFGPPADDYRKLKDPTGIYRVPIVRCMVNAVYKRKRTQCGEAAAESRTWFLTQRRRDAGGTATKISMGLLTQRRRGAEILVITDRFPGDAPQRTGAGLISVTGLLSFGDANMPKNKKL